MRKHRVRDLRRIKIACSDRPGAEPSNNFFAWQPQTRMVCGQYVLSKLTRLGSARPHGRRRPRMLSRNDEKKIWMPTIMSVAARIARRSSDSAPKPRLIQMPTMVAATRSPTSDDGSAEQQPVLEAEARPHAVEPGVLARP